MSERKIYDVRAVVLAYIYAQRQPSPHVDFRAFWHVRLAALESAYGIHMSGEVLPPRHRILWMYFAGIVQSYLALRGPRADMLEDTLLNATIERLDTPALQLQETDARLHRHLKQAREAHRQMLDRVFLSVWGPIEHPLTSAELRSRGFDDTTEPKRSDYYDVM